MDAMERAARNGHLVMVKFLHMIRAPCSNAAIQFAYLHKHIDVYHFLEKAYPDKVGRNKAGFTKNRGFLFKKMGLL